MQFLFYRYLGLLLGVVLAGAFLGSTANAQGRTITCESKYQRYQYCRVNTQNRVRLTRKLSNNPCTEGRSWGYDRRGVWVDDGCRARFEVAYRSGGNHGWDHGHGHGHRPGHSGSNRVPNWAIGHFRGYNPQYNSEVDLRIHDNGKVVARIHGRRVTGHYNARAGEIELSQVRLRVDKARRGFRTTQAGNRNNVVFYTRVR